MVFDFFFFFTGVHTPIVMGYFVARKKSQERVTVVIPQDTTILASRTFLVGKSSFG